MNLNTLQKKLKELSPANAAELIWETIMVRKVGDYSFQDDSSGTEFLLDILAAKGFVTSKSEGRRLMLQGGIKFAKEIELDFCLIHDYQAHLQTGIYKIGKFSGMIVFPDGQMRCIVV